MTGAADFDFATPAKQIDRRLAELVECDSTSGSTVAEAVSYSLLAPGKRLRPLITVMTAKYLGSCETLAYDPGCAIEMIHTASLIVDDLPCMDDATMRRFRTVNHKVFGEDTAILAAFALVSQAFGTLARADGLDPRVRTELVDLLSRTVSCEGIIGGQQADLRADRECARPEEVQRIHDRKTGALFVAAAEMGGRIAGLEGERLEFVRRFASLLGLAYQTRDDFVDVLGSRETAGKDVGVDAEKPTVVDRLGKQGAAEYADTLLKGATRSLAPLGPSAEPLVRMAQSLFDAESHASIDTETSPVVARH